MSLNKWITSYIDGLLLSDGSLSISSSVSGRYHQSCVKKEWIEKVICDFESNCIKCGGIQKVLNNGYSNGVIYRFATKSYDFFNYSYDKWYPFGKKEVPYSVEITPQCMANLYMGDGSIRNVSGSSYSIEFATYGFDSFSAELLSNKINECIGIHSYVCTDNRIFITKRNNVEKFLDYISEFIVPCFNYKLPVLKPKKERHSQSAFTWDDIHDIRDFSKCGFNQIEIASMYGVTNHCIHKIVKNINWKEDSEQAVRVIK